MGFQTIPKSVKKHLGHSLPFHQQCIKPTRVAVDQSNKEVFSHPLQQISESICASDSLRHRIEDNLKVFDIELTQTELDSLSSMTGSLNQYWQPLGAPVDVARSNLMFVSLLPLP